MSSSFNQPDGTEIIDLTTVDPDYLLDLLFRYLLQLENSANSGRKNVKTKKRRTIIDDRDLAVVSKLFFGGSTIQARELNYLEVATTAKSKRVGYSLLWLLATPNFDKAILVADIASLMRREKLSTSKGRNLLPNHFPLDHIVNCMAKQKRKHSHSHDLRDGLYISLKLGPRKTGVKIIRFVGNIEIWDIKRIGTAYGILKE